MRHAGSLRTGREDGPWHRPRGRAVPSGSAPRWTREPSATKRDHIVDELRRPILGGEPARGQRMARNGLARRFGASITPLAGGALRLLDAEGLVLAEPHGGVRVAGVDLERVKGITLLRRALPD
ncbi:GntR family transcriptional regulator [Streptomyces griseorubiginosus]|uniref:GntR family transcriptional regulator n=1 Tax=Streptomyces griseorubiginosus TaxID=67304 RepID=UPI0036ECA776